MRKTLKVLLFIFIALNLFIIIGGRTYLYKGLSNTYLRGRSGPAVDEYKIFANREVKAGEVQEWPVARDYNHSDIPNNYLEYHKKFQSIAYLIIKNDSIRYEEYWDGFDQNSVTNSFSMGKTVTGILAGIAVAEGKIKSLDDPVGNYIPEFKNANQLCVKHLLNMSSGINFDEDYVNPLAYPAAAFYGTDLKKLTFGYQLTETPGKQFKYLSGNTELLGFVITNATGKTLSDYASEKLWKPMGARNSAWWSLDHEGGMEKAYCCFNSNARDFARFGKLYLDSGRWNGNQLVPQDYVLQSIQPADLLDESGTKKIDKYGYSWWLMPGYKGHNIFYARGILGQYVIVIPDKKTIVVRLGKIRDKSAGEDHPKDVMQYIDCALEMYP